MSEYQYYEFRAVDRPLTSEQMRELRTLSTRAEITSRSFTNFYTFGSLKADPQKLLEQYFDAYVYVSNFGSYAFQLRLPLNIVPDDVLERYSEEDALRSWETKTHTIIEFIWEEEPGEREDEGGDGWIERLLPIRDELIRGDYRSLYIAWLSTVSNVGKATSRDEIAPDPRPEPLLPPGLQTPTEAQAALAEFLWIDRDLLTAAGEASPPIETSQTAKPNAAAWVAALPEPEVREIVTRLVGGEGAQLQTELMARFHRAEASAGKAASEDAGKSVRTANQLTARAIDITMERERHALAERESKRRKQLSALVPRFTELWQSVYRLEQERKASSYEKAVSLLADLRDAFAQEKRTAEFDEKFAEFLAQSSRSTALVRRLREAGLMR